MRERRVPALSPRRSRNGLLDVATDVGSRVACDSGEATGER